MKRTAAFFLALLLTLGPLAGTVRAEEEPEATEVVSIGSAEELLTFAEACARDVYSRGVTFALTADIDLGGTDWRGIGYFAGTFLGDGHVIRGLAVTGDGSRAGLFRRIAPEGIVRDLAVEGAVTPGGTRQYVGGIAGVNQGEIRDCSFTGTVAGLDSVGGIAGQNAETGSVTGCSFAGTVTGEHRVGGIAGENAGVIQKCDNAGDVNAVLITPERKSSFDLAMLSQNDFLDLTDIGGVAGVSSGVLNGCSNRGAVGYKSSGYNVGGIVGRTSGYVTGCVNTGAVEGRRDVGGIAGQLIPYSVWEFSREQMDALLGQIGAVNHQINRTREHADDLSADLEKALETMNGYTRDAAGQLGSIMSTVNSDMIGIRDRITVDPETGEISIRDLDVSQVDTSGLTAALNNLHAASSALPGLLGNTVTTAAEDIRGIAAQMSQALSGMYGVLDNLSSTALYTREDLSDSETDDHDMGAVDGCENRGAVTADSNAGGIVGTVGFEVEFDRESRLDTADLLTTQARQSLFAAIRRCESRGEILARQDTAGGIAGGMDMGAAAECVSVGAVTARNGDYAGGVAGRCAGTVKDCWARAQLSAGKYVGGIAGLGGDIRGCTAWARINGGSEFVGAVAGWAEGAVTDNLYVPGTAAGVDGVSLQGQSDPVEAEELLSREDVPEGFGSLTVTFMGEDRIIKELAVPFGGAVTERPAVPDDGERYWLWDEFDAEHVYADCTVTGRYYDPIPVLSTAEEVPLLLAEGSFRPEHALTVTAADLPLPEEGEALGAYTAAVAGYDGPLTVRVRLRETERLYVTEEGAFVPAGFTRDGQYIVFPLANGGSFVCYGPDAPERPAVLPWAAGGAGALGLLLAALIRRKKKTAPAEPGTETAATEEKVEEQKTKSL